MGEWKPEPAVMVREPTNQHFLFNWVAKMLQKICAIGCLTASAINATGSGYTRGEIREIQSVSFGAAILSIYGRNLSDN